MEWLGIALFVIGFILLGIELAAPGFGTAGLGGLTCLGAGILFTADSLEEGIMLTIIVIVISAIMLVAAMFLFNSRKGPIILDKELKAEEGMLGSDDLNYLLGKEGVASTDLRPSGKCSVDGILFDVRSDGRYVAKGTAVRICRIHENSIIVQPKD